MDARLELEASSSRRQGKHAFADESARRSIKLSRRDIKIKLLRVRIATLSRCVCAIFRNNCRRRQAAAIMGAPHEAPGRAAHRVSRAR